MVKSTEQYRLPPPTPESFILNGTAGSRLYGTNLRGVSDHDEMGVFVASRHAVIGLAPSHKMWDYSSKDDQHSPSDADTREGVAYELRHFVSLCSNGNPTALMMLYTPTRKLTVNEPAGQLVRRQRSQFSTRSAGRKFLGYLDAQLARLDGHGHVARLPKRPELIEAHGYDVKFAAHAMRLGLQGIELMTTGSLELPMPIMSRSQVLTIRTGLLSETEARAQIDDVRDELERVVQSADLPEYTDETARDELLVTAYDLAWSTE